LSTGPAPVGLASAETDQRKTAWRGNNSRHDVAFVYIDNQARTPGGGACRQILNTCHWKSATVRFADENKTVIALHQPLQESLSVNKLRW
jgi:cytidine deaminase